MTTSSPGPDAQAVQDDVAPLRRGGRERDGLRRRPEEAGERRTDLVATGEHRLEVPLTGATLLEVAGERGPHRLHGPARERPVRARVEIGEPVEDGETCADGV